MPLGNQPKTPKLECNIRHKNRNYCYIELANGERIITSRKLFDEVKK